MCSKTYYCFGAKEKLSGKGVNKKCNDINKEKYFNVLLTKQNSTGVKSFREVHHAFLYFYPKRNVLADGVSTTLLDI